MYEAFDLPLILSNQVKSADFQENRGATSVWASAVQDPLKRVPAAKQVP